MLAQRGGVIYSDSHAIQSVHFVVHSSSSRHLLKLARLGVTFAECLSKTLLKLCYEVGALEGLRGCLGVSFDAHSY